MRRAPPAVCTCRPFCPPCQPGLPGCLRAARALPAPRVAPPALRRPGSPPALRAAPALAPRQALPALCPPRLLCRPPALPAVPALAVRSLPTFPAVPTFPALPAVPALLRLNRELVRLLLRYRGAFERQRVVHAVGQVLAKVAVVGASRLRRLSRRVGGPGRVDVREVESRGGSSRRSH